MGKESEVLQAAQEGNLTKLETLFTQKRFGGLLKGPNINARGSSGCTALHLASLHGNIDAVAFLLDNDASANVPDNAGSYPLHLAAFNGHYEVANTLMTRGPSRAQVNEANMAGDTALHVAAQYGHENVVRVLLGKYADPLIRNSKEENALDLAAQYGRLLTVERFLTFDSDLCTKGAIHKHSPLHLAARNGHVDVVRALLVHGMPIDATCDMGTALHCAAMYGKVAVARLLIEQGIDIEIEDDNGQKVLDILIKHPSQLSQEITALIYANPETDEQETRSPAASYSGQQFEIVEHRKRRDTDSSGIVSQPSGYDVVPPPRPKPEKTDVERPYSMLANTSIRSSKSDDEDNLDLATVTPLPVSVENKENFFQRFDEVSATSKPYCLVGEDVSPLKSKKSIKQKRTSSGSRSYSAHPLQDDVGGTYCDISPGIPQPIPKPPRTFNPHYTVMTDTIYQVPPKNFDQKQTTQDDLYQVPPSNRDSKTVPDIPPPSPATAQQQIFNAIASESIYGVPSSYPAGEPPSPATAQQQIFDTIGSESIYGVPSGYPRQEPPSPTAAQQQIINAISPYAKNIELSKLRDQRLSSEISSSPIDSYDNVNLNRNSECYDNILLRNSPVETYDNVNIRKQASVDDTYYQRPLSSSFGSSQDSYYQRPPSSGSFSGDMYYQNPKTKPGFKPKPAEPPVDQNMQANKPPQYTSVKTKSMKQRRTATIVKKEISIETSDLKQPTAADNNKTIEQQSKEIQKTIEKAKDDLLLKATANEDEEEMPVPKPRTKQSRTSEKRVESGYRMSKISTKQPLDETYEWSKIDAFLSNLEEFAVSNSVDNKKPIATTSVTDWLESLNMLTYEPMFLANGFEEIEFINGCLDDQDLIELGILDSGHRKKIIDSTPNLPKVPVIGEDDVPIPSNVTDWLQSIKLSGYYNRFVVNGYDNIDRVRVIWELELVTVLDINSIGHRKRMLNSLGRRPPQIKAPVSWVKRFADAGAGKTKSHIPDDSMDVAQQLMETAKGLTITRDSKKSNTQQGEVTESVQQIHANAPASPPPTVPRKSSQYREERETNNSNWLHSPDVLIYESVAYSAQYLGSHPVQKVRGVESTLDACSKMKVLSQNINKMPAIALSISVRGIDYIDSNSKMIINQYGIHHISFIAQDPDDLHVFAYITRDEVTRKNYCHVFRAKSTREADEIVLTLGQCFELAYEQHMALMEIKKSQEKESSPSSSSNHPTSREPPPCPKPYSGGSVHKIDDLS